MKRFWNIAWRVSIVVMIFGMYFPSPSGIETARKVQTKNDELILVTAIKGFCTEYGHYPKMKNDSSLSGQTFLAILLGTDVQQNPHQTIFIDVQPAVKKKNGRWIGGIHPETGAWLDPYGNPYLVKIDTNNDGFIPNPYKDATAGPHPIPQGVIVWSSGKDGVFGNPKTPGQLAGSDDIISWQ